MGRSARGFGRYASCRLTVGARRGAHLVVLERDRNVPQRRRWGRTPACGNIHAKKRTQKIPFGEMLSLR
jgi:hypothetical protein